MNAPTPAADVPPPIATSAQPSSAPLSRRRWWIHLVLIGSYPLLLGLAGSGRSSAQQPALGRGASALLVICAVELVIFGFFFGLAWLASRASRDDLLWRWRGGIWPIPIGIGYSVAIRVLLGIVLAVVGLVLIATHVMTTDSLQTFFKTNRPDIEAIVDISALRQNPLYFWLSLTLVSFVVGGLREELWRSAFLAGMRKVWPRYFGSTAGQIGAVAVASVIFGLGHLVQGPLAVCLTALLGFFLGLIIVLHRSIWPAVIAHGMFDATSMALLPWVMETIKSL